MAETSHKIVALTVACVAAAGIVKSVTEKDVSAEGAPTAIEAPAPEQDECDEAFAANHPVTETSPEEAEKIGQVLITCYFGEEEWPAARQLIHNESSWRPAVVNEIGACGLPQSYPCSKMVDEMLGPGHTLEDMSTEEQIIWFNQYVESEYDTPTAALNHWNARVPINGQDVGHWY